MHTAYGVINNVMQCFSLPKVSIALFQIHATGFYADTLGRLGKRRDHQVITPAGENGNMFPPLFQSEMIGALESLVIR